MRVERCAPGDVRRPPPAAEVGAAVEEVVARVRTEGDAAVLDYTRHFDTGGAQPWPLGVEALQLREAHDGLAAPLRAALELAAGNVRAVALAAVHPERQVDLPSGQRVTLREAPVRRAAIYVPGGRAPYPSTVVMGAVTAQAAGVDEVVVCSPPGAGGDIHPTVLGACALCGVEEVYRMGGAQAVAALALGTGSIPAVEVIAGPGNVYVQEAKRRLSGVVGIDAYAGPSELLVLFDESVDPRLVALDLRAQAEHGADSTVAGVTPSAQALQAVERELAERDGEGEVLLAQVSDLEGALALAEHFAPEHLQLMGADAEALAPRVRSAGCLFVGAGSGTAFGDYVAGSNHVLPTGGWARFASGLSVRTFRRTMAEVRVPESAGELAQAGAAIARAEGFTAHADSMEARMGENHADG